MAPGALDLLLEYKGVSFCFSVPHNKDKMSILGWKEVLENLPAVHSSDTLCSQAEHAELCPGYKKKWYSEYIYIFFFYKDLIKEVTIELMSSRYFWKCNPSCGTWPPENLPQESKNIKIIVYQPFTQIVFPWKQNYLIAYLNESHGCCGYFCKHFIEVVD